MQVRDLRRPREISMRSLIVTRRPDRTALQSPQILFSVSRGAVVGSIGMQVFALVD